MSALALRKMSDVELHDRGEVVLRAADWQTFIIAVLVLAGAGYGLIFQGALDADVRLACAGFIGAVISFFFSRQVGASAAVSTVRQMGAEPSEFQSPR